MLRAFFQNWSPWVETPAAARQSGAIPYDIVEGRPVFLLVTSRRTGRWIFPKGSIGSGLTAWDSAAREAYEEAGVTGQVDSQVVGTFRNSDKGVMVDVDLYPLRVREQLDEWKERHQRLRHWALLAETKRLVGDRTIARIVQRLHDQLVVNAAAR
jgi:8-oxo-dGTP pyrophosphatase MutT (NUDIX family)